MIKFTQSIRKGMGFVPENWRQLSGYLGQIIRRTAIEHVRATLGPKGQLVSNGVEIPRDSSDRDEWTRAVEDRLHAEELVDSLPSDERQLIDWKHLYDLTDVQIAIELGVDRKTVAMRFARIYRKLRQLDASES